MKFSDLADGDAVFVDANTLVYHFTSHAVFGQPCRDLLERIEQGNVAGWTSTHVLSELAHRLMTLEACSLFGWPFAGIAQRLRRHTAEVQRLSAFQNAVDRILASAVQVLSISGPLISQAAVVSRQTGLLSNDALIVAVMQHHGLVNLASLDADFDRVPGLTRYAPV